MNKERLFEVFAKVNRLNEDVLSSYGSEEMDELRDDLEYEIKSHFRVGERNKLFREGVPQQILINIKGKNVPFNMDEENGLDLNDYSNADSSPEQITYDANYTGDLSSVDPILQNIQAELIIPVFVNLEKHYDAGKIDFWTEIWIDSEDIDIQFNKKQ
jgi:hypothetical protein